MLAIAGSIANTDKHLVLEDRKGNPKPEARIKTTSLTANGNFVIIDCDGSDRDALELAEDCVLAWRRFLAATGLREPG